MNQPNFIALTSRIYQAKGPKVSTIEDVKTGHVRIMSSDVEPVDSRDVWAEQSKAYEDYRITVKASIEEEVTIEEANADSLQEALSTAIANGDEVMAEGLKTALENSEKGIVELKVSEDLLVKAEAERLATNAINIFEHKVACFQALVG
jgi:hypothetical protein